MKKIAFLLVVGFVLNLPAQDYMTLIAEGTHTVDRIIEVAELHFDTVGRGRGTGYKQFRRWQYFAERTMDETKKLKSQEFYYNELQNYNARINGENMAARTTVGTWEEMGPTYYNATSGYNPGVGRVTSIAIEQTNLNHIIAGSETGGVWRSTDGGANWSVLTDNLANIDVYALAIDPVDSSTYYWGSTSGTIFKSTDQGATWSLHGSLPSGIINKILIHPTDTSKMYASAQGSGLYKSEDGGVTWSSIYFVSTAEGFDFEFKPGDPSIIYASGNQFYKSTNNGNSFSRIDGTGLNQFSTGNKMIAVSPNNPEVVYVLEAFQGAFGALYKSEDSGSTFVKLDHLEKNYFGYSSDPENPDDVGRGQAPRDMDIVVNPNNANDVHIAGINTWRSVDGGANFTITSQWIPFSASGQNIGYCHADVDIMEFVGSGTEAKLFLGTDGGIFRADNPTVVNSDYYTDLTMGMGIRQFYKIGISQTNPVSVTGGAQDNGSSFLKNDGNWIDWWGADGMEGFIDKNNPEILFGTTQFGSFVKSLNAGNSVIGITQPEDKGGQNSWNWVVPFEQDALEQDVIYCAFDKVYKSMDGGGIWTAISQNFNSNIDHFKVAPSNSNFMYLAINGSFWYTTNGGSIWLQSGLDLGFGRINSIAVHPTDPSKLAIATTNSQKVYVSTDHGVSWTPILWDLPAFAALSVVWQNNGNDGLYLGMNYGVYYTDNDMGNSWTHFNNGLPNVRINELEINATDHKIYAATYGRGLWRSNLFDSSLSVENFEFDQVSMYPNPAKNEVNVKWNTAQEVSIRIYNFQGKLVFFSKNAKLSNTFKIDVSRFESGAYFVKLNTNKGEITKKLLLN